MSPVKIGIIGGTGLDNPDLIENRKVNIITTPYGSSEVVQGKIGGVECVSYFRQVPKHLKTSFVSTYLHRFFWLVMGNLIPYRPRMSIIGRTSTL